MIHPQDTVFEWQHRLQQGSIENGSVLKLFTVTAGAASVPYVEGPRGKLHRHLFGVSPELTRPACRARC